MLESALVHSVHPARTQTDTTSDVHTHTQPTICLVEACQLTAVSTDTHLVVLERALVQARILAQARNVVAVVVAKHLVGQDGIRHLWCGGHK